MMLLFHWVLSEGLLLHLSGMGHDAGQKWVAEKHPEQDHKLERLEEDHR